MSSVLLDGVPEMPLADRDDLGEALFLDRPHEPLSVRVQVRTAGWEHDWLNAGGPQQGGQPATEKRIAVMDQVAVLEQEAVEPIDKGSGDPCHPFAGGLVGDPGDADPPGLQIDDEEDIEPSEAAEGPCLHGEEVRRCDGLPVRLDEQAFWPVRALNARTTTHGRV